MGSVIDVCECFLVVFEIEFAVSKDLLHLMHTGCFDKLFGMLSGFCLNPGGSRKCPMN